MDSAVKSVSFWCFVFLFSCFVVLYHILSISQLDILMARTPFTFTYYSFQLNFTFKLYFLLLPFIFIFIHGISMYVLGQFIEKINEKQSSNDLISPFKFLQLKDLRDEKNSFTERFSITFLYFIFYIIPPILLISLQIYYSKYQNFFLTTCHFLLLVFDLFVIVTYGKGLFQFFKRNRSMDRKFTSNVNLKNKSFKEKFTIIYQYIKKGIREYFRSVYFRHIGPEYKNKSNKKKAIILFKYIYELVKFFVVQFINRTLVLITRVNIIFIYPIILFFVKFVYELLILNIVFGSNDRNIHPNRITKSISRLKGYSVLLLIAEIHLTFFAIFFIYPAIFSSYIETPLFPNIKLSNYDEAISSTSVLQDRNFNFIKLSKVSFSSCVFTKSDFFGATIEKSTFNNCVFDLCKFKFVTSSDCDFEGSSFENTKFIFTISNSTNYCKTYFIKSEIYYSSFNFSDFSLANFLEADVYMSKFVESNLTGSNTCKTKIYLSNLSESTLIGVDLRRTYIINSNLTDCNLNGAILRNTDTDVLEIAFGGLYKQMSNQPGITLNNYIGSNFDRIIGIIFIDSLLDHKISHEFTVNSINSNGVNERLIMQEIDYDFHKYINNTFLIESAMRKINSFSCRYINASVFATPKILQYIKVNTPWIINFQNFKNEQVKGLVKINGKFFEQHRNPNYKCISEKPIQSFKDDRLNSFLKLRQQVFFDRPFEFITKPEYCISSNDPFYKDLKVASRRKIEGHRYLDN